MTEHFCVVLRSKPDRIERVRKEFERENVPVKYIYAAEGIAQGFAPLFAMHYEQGPDKPYYITPGMISLCDVNYYIAHMTHTFDIPDYVVYEDDVILPENFLSTLEEVKEQAPPKTRAVWLEHCCTDGREKYQVTPLLWRVKPAPLCTAAVWYRNGANQTILEKVGRFDTPWDILIEQRLANDWQPCCVVPKLVKQATFEGQMDSTVSDSGHAPYRGEWDK